MGGCTRASAIAPYRPAHGATAADLMRLWLDLCLVISPRRGADRNVWRFTFGVIPSRRIWRRFCK